jgi:hypothetical protein
MKERPAKMAMAAENKARLIKEGKLTPEQAERILTLDEIEQPKPIEPKPLEDSGPSVSVMDASNDAMRIAQGLFDILSNGAGSDEGLRPEGLSVLELVAEELVNKLKIVNGFINPEDGKD